MQQSDWPDDESTVRTAIASYNSTEAAITDLAAKYTNVVYDVTSEPGMVAAKAAYKEINAHSIVLENARVAEKAESLRYGRLVDSEAKRISDRLDALRLPIKTMIESETKRLKREAEERERMAMEEAIAKERAKKEAEEVELARQRAEIAAAKAAQEEAKRQARAKIEAEERAARLRIEEQERAARLAREEADRAARQAREVEEARLKAERDAIEEQQRKAREEAEAKQRIADEKVRKEREAEEAKQREIRRAAAEKLDARATLAAFVKHYGHMEEFAGVVEAINECLATA